MSGGFGRDWRNNSISNEKDKYDTAELFRRSSDAFNKIIADSTSNRLDLPSGHKYSSERYRYNINGTKYRDIDSSAKVTREESSFILNPDQNDTITFYSAERPRYVVGYEVSASGSLKINTALETGDKIRFGINDFQSPENAAFFEINGGDNRIVLVNQGTEVVTQTFTLPDNLDETNPIRWEIKYNWYGVGRHMFKINYTDETKKDGEKQVEFQAGELVHDTDYATSDPNKHLFTEIEASNTGKELEIGSFGYSILGDVIPTSRTKTSRVAPSSDNYSGTGNYEPLAAFKIEPDFANIYTVMKSLDLSPGTTDGELLAIAVSPDNTDASSFARPVQQSDDDSLILQTESVTTFPDSTGTEVTDAANPGGRQISFAASDVAGEGNRAARSGSVQRDKRPVYEDDIIIFLYKADSTTSDSVNFAYETEQFW